MMAVSFDVESLPAHITREIDVKTGKFYYANHKLKTTSWLHPHSHAYAKAHGHGQSPHDLPVGWEVAFCEKGDIYFIDHVTQTTTRHDPRSAPRYNDQTNNYAPTYKGVYIEENKSSEAKSKKTAIGGGEMPAAYNKKYIKEQEIHKRSIASIICAVM